MKNFLCAAAIAIGSILFVENNATAQSINGVNCGALVGFPLMCVKNMTSSPVVAIEATPNFGFNPTGWINIPGGPIMPGTTTVVKFNTFVGGDNQYISIKMANGTTHTYPFVNVRYNTSFNVVGW